ncbi:YXWGXW repeat-containing protein [Opitutus terrae]|uniref:17 kDa surface antigen n=1 Tax=Opitutus terrae (strain DSM 11246 / JCM 15787 / PB90-1) TaxID=452637 RepID=B1ZMZ9_OPITP|nr:YXWGXW repeat-containing protein [Opitutus terrae]ACB76451.1 17 kDa surface antigen [Opitutus terrae PB90-1]
MKRLSPKQQTFTLLFAALSLTAGCAGPTNNTQRGAAGGAVLGGLAGAIIGNNRGSGNAASGAAIGAAAGAIAGGAIGHSKDKREAQAASGYPSASNTSSVTNITVTGAPPMPPASIVENQPPRPNASAVWVPGYWSYENGMSYVWVPGRWEIPPPGTNTFQPPYWMQQGNGNVYVRGSWR